LFSPCSCRFRCIVGAIRHHVLLKLELTDSDLAYSAPDKNAIREVANQGYAPLSYAEVHDDFLLTASTEGPALEPSHYADRLFGEVGHYTPERGSPHGQFFEAAEPIFECRKPGLATIFATNRCRRGVPVRHAQNIQLRHARKTLWHIDFQVKADLKECFVDSPCCFAEISARDHSHAASGRPLYGPKERSL
jgi:hypothetical protein